MTFSLTIFFFTCCLESKYTWDIIKVHLKAGFSKSHLITGAKCTRDSFYDWVRVGKLPEVMVTRQWITTLLMENTTYSLLVIRCFGLVSPCDNPSHKLEKIKQRKDSQIHTKSYCYFIFLCALNIVYLFSFWLRPNLVWKVMLNARACYNSIRETWSFLLVFLNWHLKPSGLAKHSALFIITLSRPFDLYTLNKRMIIVSQKLTVILIRWPRVMTDLFSHTKYLEYFASPKDVHPFIHFQKAFNCRLHWS